MSIQVVDFEPDHYLGDGDGCWSPSWGSPLIHRLIKPHLRPGDKVLDLCSGWGRASLCLSLQGCDVTLVDQDSDILEYARDLALQMDYGINTINSRAEVITSIFPKTRFKAITILEGLVHLYKTEAIKILKQACSLLLPGGFIYVDAPSTLDWHYDSFQQYNEQVDTDTFVDMCGCTGAYQPEAFCFFHPGELSLSLHEQGLRTLYTYSDYPDKAIKSIAIGQKIGG